MPFWVNCMIMYVYFCTCRASPRSLHDYEWSVLKGDNKTVKIRKPKFTVPPAPQNPGISSQYVLNLIILQHPVIQATKFLFSSILQSKIKTIK